VNPFNPNYYCTLRISRAGIPLFVDTRSHWSSRSCTTGVLPVVSLSEMEGILSRSHNMERLTILDAPFGSVADRQDARINEPLPGIIVELREK